MSATPRLRILHTESSLGWGGQEIRVLTEARGVARRGHHVVIAAPAEARIFQEAPRYGVEAVALPIGRKRIRGQGAQRGQAVRNTGSIRLQRPRSPLGAVILPP